MCTSHWFHTPDAVQRQRDGRPLTHPVQPVAVMPPVVTLHQHLGQAAGMMGLGAHGYHAALDKALHLCLCDQTSAQEEHRQLTGQETETFQVAA